MGLVKGLMECVCVCVRERVGEEFQVSNCNGLERKVCVTFGVLRIGNYCYNFQKPANRGLLRWKLWGKMSWVCVILLTWWVFIGLVGLGVWWSGTVDWCFLYTKLRFFVMLTGSFGFAVILTDTAFLIRGNMVIKKVELSGLLFNQEGLTLIQNASQTF